MNTKEYVHATVKQFKFSTAIKKIAKTVSKSFSASIAPPKINISMLK
jgi:hypothetical protein